MRIITHPIFFEGNDWSHHGSPEGAQRFLKFLPLIDGLEEVINHWKFNQKRDNTKDFDERYVLAQNGRRYLSLFHTNLHVNNMESIAKFEHGFLEPARVSLDTFIDEISFEASLYAVGAAVQAAEFARGNMPALALVRPPGHHAHKDKANGFCLFNNVAIASEYLIKAGEKKVLILDVDLHEGDGTIDYVEGHESTRYISIGQKDIWPFLENSESNRVKQFLMDKEDGDQRFMKLLYRKVKPVINEFNPSIIAVSYGLDGHISDRNEFGETFEGGLNLTRKGYDGLWKFLHSLHIPFFAVLEGGYSQNALYDGINSFMEGNSLPYRSDSDDFGKKAS